jgi:hypothetical protein
MRGNNNSWLRRGFFIINQIVSAGLFVLVYSLLESIVVSIVLYNFRGHLTTSDHQLYRVWVP